jgi:exonuclease SbcD
MHISDTHVGKRQYNLESREKDIYEVFETLIDTAISERVDAVIHTGDLFDVSNPSTEAEMVVVKNLMKLKERGIPFIGIPGDHDTPKRRGATVHEMLQNLGLVRVPDLDKPIEVGQVKFYGKKHVPLLSESTREEFQKIIRGLRPQGKSVLMLHQGVKEWLPFDYSYQLTLDDLPKDFVYVALGHLHFRKRVRRENGSYIAVAGSPDIIDEREIEDYKNFKKGAWLVDLSKDEPVIQGKDLEIRPQDVIAVSTKNLEEEIRAKAPKPVRGKLPIIHLILEGEPIKKDVLMKKISSLEGVIAEKIRIYKDNTYLTPQDKAQLTVNTGSINDLILEYLVKREGYKDDEARLILKMILSDDEDEILNAVRTFAGV